MMFLDCPAYLDAGGAVRCRLPAEVTGRFTLRSTDGPLEGASIRCPAGHFFNGPIESLTCDSTDTCDPGTAGPAVRAGRDRPQRAHAGQDGGSGSARRDYPAESERRGRRPDTTPAYYLGQPAARWIAATRPRSRGNTVPIAPFHRVTGVAWDDPGEQSRQACLPESAATSGLG